MTCADADRRRDQRLDGPYTVLVRHPDGDVRETLARCTDLSSGGCAIETTTVWADGEVVGLQFCLDRRVVAATGRILRRDRTEPHTERLGVSLQWLSVADREALECLVDLETVGARVPHNRRVACPEPSPPHSSGWEHERAGTRTAVDPSFR